MVRPKEDTKSVEESLAGCLGGGVDFRRGGFLESRRAMVGMLFENSPPAEGSGAALAVVGGGFFLDFLHQVANPLLVLLGREIGPAGQRGEGKAHIFLEVDGPDFFSSLLDTSCVAEGRAMDPDSGDGLSRHEGLGTVESGPLAGAGDEAFFTALAQEVFEPRDLAHFFVGDRYAAVSPGPDFPFPVVESAGLLGDVAGDEVHEGGEVFLGVTGGDEVVVIGGHREADDFNGILFESFGDDSGDQEIEPPGGSEKVVAQEAALCDFGKKFAGRKEPR